MMVVAPLLSLMVLGAALGGLYVVVKHSGLW